MKGKASRKVLNIHPVRLNWVPSFFVLEHLNFEEKLIMLATNEQSSEM
jgi:hypothetical protein